MNSDTSDDSNKSLLFPSVLFEDPLADLDQSAQAFENCFPYDFGVSNSFLQTKVDPSSTLILRNTLSAETENTVNMKLLSSAPTQKFEESAKKKGSKDNDSSQVLFSSVEIVDMFNRQIKPKNGNIMHYDSLDPKLPGPSNQLSLSPNIHIFSANSNNAFFNSERNEFTPKKLVDPFLHNSSKSPFFQIMPKVTFNPQIPRSKSDTNLARISSPELEVDSDTKSPNDSPPEPQSASNSPKILFSPIKIPCNKNDANSSVWLDATGPCSINLLNAQSTTCIKPIETNDISSPDTLTRAKKYSKSSTTSFQNDTFPHLDAQKSSTAVKDYIFSYSRPNATITRLKLSTADQYFLDSLAPDEAAKDPKIWDQTKTK